MKKIIVALLTIVLMTQNAYAIEYSQDLETEVITVSGKVEDPENTNLVSIDVQNENGDTIYITFIPTENGTFDYSFELPDSFETGTYNIIFSSSGNIDTISKFYVSEDDVNGIITELNGSVDVDSVINVLTSYCYPLEISERWLEITTYADKREIASELFNNKPYENKDIPEIKNTIRNLICDLAFIRAENEIDIYNAIDEFSDLYNLETNTKFYQEYIELKDELKKQARGIMAQNADESATLYKIFDVGMLLTLLSNTKQPLDVITLIDENREIITFNLSIYDSMEKTALARKLSVKTFCSLLELENAIKSAHQELHSSNNSSSSGGNGSSSGKNSDDGQIIIIPSQAVQSPSTASNKVFYDIEEVTWAKEAITKLAEKGIVSGVSENKYAPLDFLTREQFVVMLMKAFEISSNKKTSVFYDLTEDHWAYESINVAYEKGIVNGIGNSNFGIGQNITRQDIAVMAVNTMDISGYKLDKVRDVNLADISNLPAYSSPSIIKLYSAGIINGYDDGTFRGYAYATRAEAAQIIYNILKRGVSDEK